MPIASQTSNIPGLSYPSTEWATSFEAWAAYVFPGAPLQGGVRQGCKLGIPLTSGQPVAGLTPTMTNGVVIIDNSVIGINGQVTTAASLNFTNRRIFFGLSGYYYADSNNTQVKPTDVLLGEITTDATDSIISIAQPYNYGNGRFGVKALLNVAKANDGADRVLFSWTAPAGADAYDYIRVPFAQSRVVAAATGGNDTGDDNLLKIKVDSASAATIATLTAANLGSAGTTVRATADDADAYSFPAPTTIQVIYNQTDATTALAGGLVEYYVEFVGF